MTLLKALKLLPIIFYISCASTACAQAGIDVIDDVGNTVHLSHAAQRIISLAPHTTELLFSASAGDKVVGVVQYSNFPEAAQNIKRVGSLNQFDFETILSLKPDLIVSWHSGNSDAHIEKLKSLGLNMFVSEPRSLEDIATNVERIAMLSGTTRPAKAVVQQFRQDAQWLKKTYSSLKPVTVFYQIWQSPLMTLNGEHLFTDVVDLCGGKNIFADLPALAPHVSIESVLKNDPEVIIASGMTEARPDWLDDWNKWPQLKAVKEQHLYFIPPDLIQRHTVRILQGARLMCEQLDGVRHKKFAR